MTRRDSGRGMGHLNEDKLARKMIGAQKVFRGRERGLRSPQIARESKWVTKARRTERRERENSRETPP